MGVDRTSYLLYGFKVDNKKQIKIFDDHYDELMEESPYSEMFNNSKSKQTIVFDGMCGDYVYIGLCLAELEEYDDRRAIEISGEDILYLNNKLFNAVDNWPKYLQDLFKGVTPKLYFFIHAY